MAILICSRYALPEFEWFVSMTAAGFLSYDGLPFEKFVIIVLESTILYSGWRVWKTELRPKQKGKVKKIAFK